mmetsp:Transcript_9275/g.12770  ORF Transcript_9275/g.12770 Transcript_9275/m.12770 type:complete len:732 (+) Transcript_9275:110-2305(+)
MACTASFSKIPEEIIVKTIILLCLTSFVTSTTAVAATSQLTTRIFWTGGATLCTPTDCLDSNFWNGTYACNYDSLGNWNNGTATFLDPLTPLKRAARMDSMGSNGLLSDGSGSDYLVTQIKISVGGRFNCMNLDEGVYAVFSVDDVPINDVGPLPSSPDGCSCPTCITTYNVTSIAHSSGWPNYVYNGYNTLSIYIPENSQNAMCISYVDVTVIFVPVDPIVYMSLPPWGPVSGGTVVTFFGTNFIPGVTYLCLFGNNSSPTEGVVQNKELMTCTTPSSDVVGSVPILLYVVTTSVTINPGISFQYYLEPTLTQPVPSKGLCDGNATVLIQGANFQNISTMRCLWNSQPQTDPARYINSSFISCTTVEAGSGLSFAIAVSVNGQDRTSGTVTYTCVSADASTSDDGLKIPGWAWIVIVFAAVVTIVAFLVIGSRRCAQKNEEWEKDHTNGIHTPLLSGSGMISDVFVKQVDPRSIRILQKIGKGTFGEVYKGLWNGTEVAIKFFNMPSQADGQFLQDFNKEVNIMKSLRHPNVLQFLGSYVEPPNVCIVMEFMSRGSLYKILHDETAVLDMKLVTRMIIDAARGMNYLHKSNPIIIHRDLKSHNLLVDENWKVKVCDFGLSTIFTQEGLSMTACGTPSWSAPEILRNEKYTEKADVYSFGIVLWECISREDPYAGMAPFQVVIAVGTKGLRPTVPPHCPANWSNLMQECWQENASKRPSFDECIERLEGML